MKNVRTTAILLISLMSPLTARPEEINLPPENLPALVATALSSNPELKSSESRWKMFTGKARQAGALDDPMLMVKMQNMPVRDPLVFNKDPQSAVVVGVSQQLPFWGKRDLRKKIALYEADSYKWAFEERKRELSRMVKESFYKLWVIDREVEIVDRNLKLLGDFVTLTGLKYSVGQGIQQDIYKAGLEKSKMVEMQISLQQQRKSLEATINYLLYRPANTPVGPTGQFTMPRILLTAAQLNDIALENRPQLKSLGSLVEKGSASRQLAGKENYPDLNLSVEYMFKQPVTTAMTTDPGDNMFSVGVAFNLPLWQEKRQAMVAESLAETAMSTDELNALKNNISYTITQTLYELERLRKTITLYREGILPQARQSLESALIGYRAGKVDFLTVIDGRMTLFNYQHQQCKAEAEYMIKIAELETTIGLDLPVPSDNPPASPAAASARSGQQEQKTGIETGRHDLQ
ncbi:MAG: TolC family protein [Chlorobiaceae bacterium]|nr:TolC family protein [Chlorobiaceae bacterium]